MIDVTHSSCGGVAFRLLCTIEDARAVEVLDSAMVVYDDGRLVDDGTGLRCQACDRGISDFLLFDGDQVWAGADGAD